MEDAVDHEYWASQSRVTDPGAAGRAIDDLPCDLHSLRVAGGGSELAAGVPLPGRR
jgi:hypothetical protein